MKTVWLGAGRLVLVTTMCLVALIGPAALPANGASCAELVSDGGFETGGAWQLGATAVPPQYVAEIQHTGAQSLRLGIPQGENTNSYSSARQLVTIPAGATQATLSFWVYATVGADSGADKMHSLLLNSEGATLAVVWTSVSDNPSWSQLTYDVAEWLGQTVQLYFNVYNDGTGGTTGMYLDDVSLTVCPDGELPAATPTAPSSADQAADSLATGEPSSTPPEESLGTPAPLIETPAMVFFTPEGEVGPEYSQEATQPLPTDSAPAATQDPSLSSEAPALVFFTPTTGPALSSTALASVETGSAAWDVGAVGSATPQLTRVSLLVTPPQAPSPRPTRIIVASRAPGDTSASRTASEAPFAQWPRGWWLAVGAVFAIILAAGLFAWRG